MFDLHKLADQVFASDENITLLCVVDNQYKLLGLKIREGRSTYATEESIRDYVSIAAPIVVEAFAKREQFLGHVEGVLCKYEKRLLLFCPMGERIVVLGFEPKAETVLVDRAVAILKEVSALLN